MAACTTVGQPLAAPQAVGHHTAVDSILHSFFFFFFFLVEESLHAHRCQSYQQSERQIKQTTGECRVGSTSYDKGSCFSIA